jgi:hypothetical protein
MKNKFITKVLSLCLLLLGLVPLASMTTQAANNMHALTASQLTDNTGLVYIGYDVDKALLAQYLIQLKTHLGEHAFEKYRAAQSSRDHHSFHITLINPYEYPDVKSIDVTTLPPITFTFEGLGTVSKGNNNAYFVVASAEPAQKIRHTYGLKNKDFHITLGFDTKDVFGVSKGVDSLVIK